MSKILDACGLTCPAPVLLVKDLIEKEQPEAISVIVDNEPSRENVTRFLNSKGYSVELVAEENTFSLNARSNGEPIPQQASPTVNVEDDEADRKQVVMIMTDRMGSGDDELGKKLMINYIKTLKEMGPELWQIIFVNSGVKLTIDSSPVLEELKSYRDEGVTILACGTCLEHFDLLNKKEVGDTTNMLDIVMATQLADKVITMS